MVKDKSKENLIPKLTICIQGYYGLVTSGLDIDLPKSCAS